MKNNRLKYLLLYFLMLIPCSCSGEKDPTADIPPVRDDISLNIAVSMLKDDFWNQERWQSICIYLTEHRQFEKLIEIAEPYYNRMLVLSKTDEKDAIPYIGICLAQAELFMENYGKAEQYLIEVEKHARPGRDDNVLLSYHNIYAIIAMKSDMDYVDALNHLNTALEIASRTGSEQNKCNLLCNIATTYYDRSDTAGMPYAQKAYDISRESGNDFVIGYSSILMAQMYSLKHDFRSALKYADSAYSIMSVSGNRVYLVPLKLTYGEIYTGMGKYQQAEEQFEYILDSVDRVEPGNMIEVMYKYGKLKIAQGNTGEAIEVWREGLFLSTDLGNMTNRYELLQELSYAYDIIGQKDSALKYYKIFHKLSDSISVIQRERELNSFLVERNRVQYESMLQAGELKLQKRNISLAFIVSIMCLSAIWIWIRHKDRLSKYEELANRYMMYKQRTDSIISTLKSQTAKNGEEERDTRLFECLETLMTRQKIYRNKDISVDKVAEILGTNRSYVSYAINRCSDTSFWEYINHKRIEEAISILCEDKQTVPMSELASFLGYSSLSTFSRVFKSETGCPPSKYREIILKSGHGQSRTP